MGCESVRVYENVRGRVVDSIHQCVETGEVIITFTNATHVVISANNNGEILVGVSEPEPNIERRKSSIERPDETLVSSISIDTLDHRPMSEIRLRLDSDLQERIKHYILKRYKHLRYNMEIHHDIEYHERLVYHITDFGVVLEYRKYARIKELRDA